MAANMLRFNLVMMISPWFISETVGTAARWAAE